VTGVLTSQGSVFQLGLRYVDNVLWSNKKRRKRKRKRKMVRRCHFVGFCCEKERCSRLL